jgi:hypothetical protein
MRSVAEWFIVTLAATAKTYDRATRQIVFVTGAIVDFDLALDPQRAVVVYSDFRRHRFRIIDNSALILIPQSATQAAIMRPSLKP